MGKYDNLCCTTDTIAKHDVLCFDCYSLCIWMRLLFLISSSKFLSKYVYITCVIIVMRVCIQGADLEARCKNVHRAHEH